MHYNIFYTDDDIDDQEMFLSAAKEISDKINVTTQGNGNDLLAVLKDAQNMPDVVFLDLNMHLKTGYEVLKEIRSSERIKDLPVVIFTTSDHNMAIETTRKLGANLYVPKPLSFASLKRILQHVFSINWKTFTATDNEFVYRVN